MHLHCVLQKPFFDKTPLLEKFTHKNLGTQIEQMWANYKKQSIMILRKAIQIVEKQKDHLSFPS